MGSAVKANTKSRALLFVAALLLVAGCASAPGANSRHYAIQTIVAANSFYSTTMEDAGYQHGMGNLTDDELAKVEKAGNATYEALTAAKISLGAYDALQKTNERADNLLESAVALEQAYSEFKRVWKEVSGNG